jgi:integrase
MTYILDPLLPTEVHAVLAAARTGPRPLVDVALISVALDVGPRRSEIRGIHLAPTATMADPVAAVGAGPHVRLTRVGGHTTEALGRLHTGEEARPVIGDRGLFGDRLPTDGGLHERILQLGIRAGIGGSLTARRLRRTWLATVLRQGFLPDEVIATLVDHHPEGLERASAGEALAAQFEEGWRSPLDEMVEAGRRLTAAA